MDLPCRSLLSLSLSALLGLGCTAPRADVGDPAGQGDVSAGEVTSDSAAAAGLDAGADSTLDRGPIVANLAHPLQHLDLRLTLPTAQSPGQGEATWRVAAAPLGGSVSFEAGGLIVAAVTSGAPETPQDYEVREGQLHVRLPPSETPITLTVRYSFESVASMTGLMAAGSVVTWPDFCGNLFPCHSNPAEGVTWSWEVSGAPPGHTVVGADTMTVPAPSYALAFAVGPYAYTKLGTTPGGLEVGVWLKADQVTSTTAALADFPKAVAWLESTLGPYPFGKRMAAVSVPWGLFAYGGLEMHPVYHVSDGAVADLAVHCHEAAHGWFGNGVRIACWEDLVLSEGVADYLMVRARAAALGDEAMAPMWAAMSANVASKAGGLKDMVVWPQSCGEVDVDGSGLNGKLTYHKGALFLRAVAEQTSYAKVDAALGAFAKANIGQARRMTDLLATLKAETGFDPTALATLWLQTPGDPQKP